MAEGNQWLLTTSLLDFLVVHQFSFLGSDEREKCPDWIWGHGAAVSFSETMVALSTNIRPTTPDRSNIGLIELDFDVLLKLKVDRPTRRKQPHEKNSADYGRHHSRDDNDDNDDDYDE